MKHRLIATSIHIATSLMVAALAALLVFSIWYPFPYRDLSGGRELFLLVVLVDVVLGPLLTLAVFDTRKGMSVIRRDLAVIVLLQFAALCYGMWTVFVARPVYLVFEVDRFQVVSAVQIDPSELAAAMPPYDVLPLWRVQTVGTRKVRDSDEKLETLGMALGGIDVGMRPKFYQPYESSKAEVLVKSKPVSWLREKYKGQASILALIEQGVKDAGLPESELKVLPVLGRADWVALLDAKSAQIKAFAPVSAF